MKLICLLCLLMTSIYPPSASAQLRAAEEEFAQWIDNLRIEARATGISADTLKAAFADINTPLKTVIELDRKQPEDALSLEEYIRARVNQRRISNGRKMMDRYPIWLKRVERDYGVQSRFLLALWGIETDYGAYTGNIAIIHALATLAHDGRRSAYFRKELLDALQILDKGQISLGQMKGSWAGAMGQCQFMPSSFRRYAVDAEGDGRVNLWDSVPDVLASAANYLKQEGWQQGQSWGYPVDLPEKFDLSLAGLETRLPLAHWQNLGVTRTGGKTLPQAELSASLIIPDGPEGQAYLVYDNFRVLRVWNRSNAFAISVGTLADKFAAIRKNERVRQ